MSTADSSCDGYECICSPVRYSRAVSDERKKNIVSTSGRDATLAPDSGTVLYVPLRVDQFKTS